MLQKLSHYVMAPATVGQPVASHTVTPVVITTGMPSVVPTAAPVTTVQSNPLQVGGTDLSATPHFGRGNPLMDTTQPVTSPLTPASVATVPSDLSYIQGHGLTPVTVSHQGGNPSVTMHSPGVQTQSGTYVGSSSECSTAPSGTTKEVLMAEFSRLFDQIGL